mgnify:CR=1 FL=1
MEFIEFLKENAEYFERKAHEAINEKPRFVLFFVEQSLQLYVKYILARVLEDYPRTHRLRILFQELSKVDENASEFYEEYSDVMDLIEEAYITARYLGKEYSEKSAKRALEVLSRFKERFGKWLASA